MPPKRITPTKIVDFSTLIAWYQKQCNDDWEHQYGVRLETLDNPGWMLTIDLVGTALEKSSMIGICEGVDAADHPEKPQWILPKP